MAGHVSPEAAAGGPLAAVRDGDIITIDVPGRALRIDLADQELAARLTSWSAPAPRHVSGVMGKYARLVSSATDGAVTAAVGCR
jgi:dihydroxy-acid dehydratase